MSCRSILRVITNIGKWIPIVFVISVACFSFYAYNIIFLKGYIDDIIARIFIGLFFNLIFFLFLWSYLMTVFTSIKMVPEQFHLPSELRMIVENSDGIHATDTLRKFVHDTNLPIRTCDPRTGYIRYCYKCGWVKPDRASHCSVCDQCVMKYDHHCIWVNNCVNFFNYKYFILFLFYGFILCLYGSLTIFPNFIDLINHRNIRHGEIYIIILFFFAGMFGISLVALLGFHMYLVSKNLSTVEFARPPILECGPFKGAYDLGICHNIQQVFGKNLLKWPFPIHSSIGTGFEYPLSPRYYSILYSEDTESGNRQIFSTHYQTTPNNPSNSTLTTTTSSNQGRREYEAC